MNRWPALLLLLATACQTARPTSTAAPEPQAARAQQTSAPAESKTPDSAPPSAAFKSVVAVIPVKDHAKSAQWYASWIGRGADLTPAEGIAEWQLAGSGWIQVSLEPERAGSTTVALEVQDLGQQQKILTQAKVSTGEIKDYGVVKLLEILDPDGNKILFVQPAG